MVERENPIGPIDVEEATVALDTAEALTGVGKPEKARPLAEYVYHRLCKSEESDHEILPALQRAGQVAREAHQEAGPRPAAKRRFRAIRSPQS